MLGTVVQTGVGVYFYLEPGGVRGVRNRGIDWSWGLLLS